VRVGICEWLAWILRMQRPGPPAPTLEDMMARMHGKTVPPNKGDRPTNEKRQFRAMSNGYAKNIQPLSNMDDYLTSDTTTTDLLIDTVSSVKMANTTTTERPLRCCPTSSSWTVSENGDALSGSPMILRDSRLVKPSLASRLNKANHLTTSEVSVACPNTNSAPFHHYEPVSPASAEPYRKSYAKQPEYVLVCGKLSNVNDHSRHHNHVDQVTRPEKDRYMSTTDEETPSDRDVKLYALLGDILGELRKQTERSREEDVSQELCNDWKFAANVVDRLCFFMFTAFTLGCTFGVLFSADYISA